MSSGEAEYIAEIVPEELVPEGQTILYEGKVFKLEADSDPSIAKNWLLRQMWLTSTGSIFYWSQRHQKPFGRPIGGLTIEERSFPGFEYAFELSIADPRCENAKPTVLATTTAKERAEWIKHLLAYKDQDDDLFPFDGLFGRWFSGGDKVPAVVKDLRTQSWKARRRGSTKESEEGLRNEVGAVPSKSANVWNSQEHRRSFARRRDSESSSNMAVPFSPKSPKKAFGGSDAFTPPSRSGSDYKRRQSQHRFAERDQTVLILDWDDTIFPTTWVREDVCLEWQRPLVEQLSPSSRGTLIKDLFTKHETACIRFLDLATKQANVIIVTLARRPWVNTSASNFTSKVHRLIESRKIMVVYAQESKAKVKQDRAEDDFQSPDQAFDFWTKVKQTAIAQELENYHSRLGASWKNIISFGDSDFERFGTMSAGEEYMRKELDGGQCISDTGATLEGISKDGLRRKLRTKTLKMLGEPTVEEMTAELTLLTMWLPFMISMDHGFDFEIDNTDDDDELNELHAKVTGEQDASLSWPDLAGMDNESSEDEDDDGLRGVEEEDGQDR